MQDRNKEWRNLTAESGARPQFFERLLINHPSEASVVGDRILLDPPSSSRVLPDERLSLPVNVVDALMLVNNEEEMKKLEGEAFIRAGIRGILLELQEAKKNHSEMRDKIVELQNKVFPSLGSPKNEESDSSESHPSLFDNESWSPSSSPSSAKQPIADPAGSTRPPRNCGIARCQWCAPSNCATSTPTPSGTKKKKEIVIIDDSSSEDEVPQKRKKSIKKKSSSKKR